MKTVNHVVIVKLFILFIMAQSQNVVAYELATHARITLAAISRSVLGDLVYVNNLGIDGSSQNPFGDKYYDISGAEIRERKEDIFELKLMPLAPEQKLIVQSWLMRGAIREDDAYGESNPQDDLYPANATLRRPLHHFYDPYKNQALNVFLLPGLDNDVHKSPDWALGTRDVFNDPNTPEANRRNHFTVLDAREAMYRALTGKPAWSSAPMTPGGTAVTEAVRKAYWATTFRALGDVVHLIQDAAQPQHTHLPLFVDFNYTARSTVRSA